MRRFSSFLVRLARFGLLFGMACWTVSANAQENPFTDEGPEPTPDPGPPLDTTQDVEVIDVQCLERCGPGFSCTESGCTPVCQPACGAGMACVAPGSCQPIGSTQGYPPQGQQGYTPPGGYAGGGTPGYRPQFAPVPPPPPMRGTRATRRAITGFSASAVSVLLGGIGTLTVDDSFRAGRNTAGMTLAFLNAGLGVITLPVLAAGSRYVRRSGGVEGSGALRVIGWIAFGGSMLMNALITPITASDGNDTRRMHWAGGVLNAVSLLFASADALMVGMRSTRRFNAAQRAAEPESVSLVPSLNILTGPDGASGAVVGFGGTL